MLFYAIQSKNCIFSAEMNRYKKVGYNLKPTGLCSFLVLSCNNHKDSTTSQTFFHAFSLCFRIF